MILFQSHGNSSDLMPRLGAETPVTWHASVPQHPAPAALASTVARKVTTKLNVPMNALPVHSRALVVFAKRQGMLLESVRRSRLQNAITAQKRVSCSVSFSFCDAMSLHEISGHTAQECTNPRAIDWTGVPDMTPDDAWNELKRVDKERDLDDFRQVGRD